MEDKKALLEKRISRLEKLIENDSLEDRVAKLESIVAREAYRYEWSPNVDAAVKIINTLLKDAEVNPDGAQLKDMKVDEYPDQGSVVVNYGNANVDFSSPAANKILNKYKSFKTYDVSSSDFKDRNYFSIKVYTKDRKWYDPEFGSDFDRDEYMSNRRAAEWGRAQRDNHNWW